MRLLRSVVGVLLMTAAAGFADASHGADSPCGKPDLVRSVAAAGLRVVVVGWTDPDGTCLGATVASPGYGFAGDAQCGADTAPLPFGVPGGDWVGSKFEPVPRALCVSAGIVLPESDPSHGLGLDLPGPVAVALADL